MNELFLSKESSILKSKEDLINRLKDPFIPILSKNIPKGKILDIATCAWKNIIGVISEDKFLRIFDCDLMEQVIVQPYTT